MKKHKIIFMGTPDFAVPALKGLLDEGYAVVGVITAPDKPAGRGQQLRESPVKKFAVEQNLHVLQPNNLKAPDFIEELQALKADLQIVVAFRMLPEIVWNMPPLGTINLHGSLLPHYRGAAPINWAVINGETESGVTTFKLQHKIDTGDILFREKVAIGADDTAGELHDKLMEIGAKLIVATVNLVTEGKATATSQADIDENTLKHAPKLFTKDCQINWENTAAQVHNKVRGLSPFPTAWTELEREGQRPDRLKVYKTKRLNSNNTGVVGSIQTDGKTFLNVSTGEGTLALLELQMAGKKRMDIESFLRGVPISSNAKMLTQ